MSKVNIGEDLYLKGRIGWKGLSKDEYLPYSDYRIINATSLEDNLIDWSQCGYINKERYEESHEIMLQENDILISKDGTLGKIGYVKELSKPSTVASGVFVLRNTSSDIIDTDYLYHFLKSQIFKDFIYRNKAMGSTINHLYQRDLSELEIEVPSLDKQKKAAKILSSLDAKILLNNKINTELLNLVKLLYNFWFLQFEFPNEEGQPYKSSGGSFIWNEVVGMEIPRDWEVVTLAGCCNFNQNNISTKDKHEYIYYLDTSNITNNIIDNIKIIDCKNEKVPSRAKRKVKVNDIVYSTVRPNQNHHGLIKKPLENMIVSTGFAVLSHKVNSKVNDVIYTFLTQDKVQSQLQTIAETSVSAYPSINPNDIMNLTMILPKDINLLERLAYKFNSIFNTISQKQEENKELIKLREWLLPLLMNGQVTFKDTKQ